MALFLTRTFQKNFLRVPKNSQSKLEAALREIHSNLMAGKKLLGDLEGEFSFRIGAYRIIYFTDQEKNIWVETVKHRRDVYKR
jgi:mRNA-degrading endonuclease RelE of RelBE toxin-antitoxin system